MAIARWNPMSELTNLSTTMDRIFGDLLQGGLEGTEANQFRLPVDIIENEDGYQIKAPLSGFKPDEVDVNCADGVLTIEAKHMDERSEKPDKKGHYIRREVRRVDFMRQIALPPDVRAEDIKASFDNGELMIEVPRAKKPRAHRVLVERKSGKSEPQAVGSGSRN
jgi:HSP20 family molecular chaperone IbpA